jgi:RNA polymerase sigma-70 factor (ECF subfamily)
MVGGDDSELLSRAREGDVEAFAELVHRYENGVRGVLIHLLNDDRDVEEATQDVFVKAWRNLDRFRGEAAIFTWLYRIAVNEALARLRRKKLPTTEIDEATEQTQLTADSREEPHAAAESGELEAFLAAQLRLLEPEYRAPLVLRDVVGLSNEEVAVILGLSLAATKSRIHRARMRIREAYVRWEAS